jgi:hypothetical protein
MSHFCRCRHVRFQYSQRSLADRYGKRKETTALSLENQQPAQHIFMQLIHLGEGTEDTRRLATRAELGEDNWGLIPRLADARLTVSPYRGKYVLVRLMLHISSPRRWAS